MKQADKKREENLLIEDILIKLQKPKEAKMLKAYKKA